MAHYSSLTFYLDNWEKILIIKKKIHLLPSIFIPDISLKDNLF